MGFRINTNIGAMNAHRNSVQTNLRLDKSLQALSSGLRINTAADDASGLAIANSLRSQANGLGQAIANANDGVGVMQTADGALDEYENIINTIRTKSIQAASDGQNADSRSAIQNDINKLLEEAQNIATTTQFNGQKLLDGTYTDKAFHIGAYANETVNVSINNAQTTSIGAYAQTTGDVTTGDLAAGDLLINGQDVGIATIDAKDQARAINSISTTTGVTATAKTSTADAATATTAVAGGDIADGEVTINGISIGTLDGVNANDADGRLTRAINAIADQTGVTATLAAGIITLEANDGRDITVSDTSTGSVTGLASETTHGKISLESDNAIVIAGTAPGDAGFTAGTIALTGNAAGADVSTRENAEDTIKIMDHALKQLDAIRSEIGSSQNQLESTVRNISVTQVNVAAAESQIRDVDFAAESANFSKQNILAQSGSYAMSQANAVQQNVMRLLQ
ncbi:MAG: flagellin [Epsilonproteobacteria bacterium]|nr:flagellin [Campylobacterota bacterium]